MISSYWDNWKPALHLRPESVNNVKYCLDKLSYFNKYNLTQCQKQEEISGDIKSQVN